MPKARSARTLRERAPLFAALLGRPTDAFDVAVFLTLVGLVGSASMCGSWALLSSLAALVGLLTAAQIALFTWALAALLRGLTRRRLDALAYALGAALLLVGLGLDRVHFALLREHMSVAVVLDALTAFRTKAIPVDYGTVGVVVLSAVALFVVLSAFLKALSFLPRSQRRVLAARHAAIPSLLLVGSLASLRECALDPPGTALLPMRRAIPWDAVAHWPETALSQSDEHARVATLFGAARIFDELQAARGTVAAHPPHARARPDILIVHVESFRADMLRDETAPHLTAFASECLGAPMHFTTGTNTGTGVFGILNGLTAPLYPLARSGGAHPMPLEVLRALGYDVSVFFISNFGTYDGLYDLFFQNIADYRYAGPEEPVWDADAKMVDTWIARLRAGHGDMPRFDYLVLDSTHYDYSYPPSFEKFTPAMTLDLGARDILVIQEGINDKLRGRAPFVRNRYENSVLYADSLVAKMLDALRETRRLDDTVVVVTGDHGEEFWEHGAFGHGFFSLSNEQTHVPLLMRLPPALRRNPSRYRYSSHADVFPTIFDAMGLEGVPRFMNGKSLLGYDGTLDVALVGFGVTGSQSDLRYAVVGEGLKVYFRDTPPFDVTDVVRDSDDRLTDRPAGLPEDLVVRALANQELR